MKMKQSSLQKLSVIDGTMAYAQLKQEITQAGILDRAYGYYTMWSLFVFAGFFFSVCMIFVIHVVLLLIFWSLALAFFTVQIGGLLHDAGHRAIFKSAKANDLFGFFCGSFINMSYGHWRKTHNMHHSHTNQEDEDPDLEIPLHAFTEKKFLAAKGVSKALGKYQAWTYFPIRTLVIFSRRILDMRYFTSNFTPTFSLQIIIFGTGVFFWLLLPFLIFPFTKALLLFFVVNFSIGFYLSNVFAPNHKGMPQLPKDIKISFLEHQIMTSRNINSHWLTDIIFIGLNYQIEHHLFPNCPRNKLKKITPYVEEICRKMNLEFTSVGVIESNKIILSELNRVAKTPRK